MKNKSLLYCVVLVFISCTSMHSFKGTAELHGAVYDVRNRPVPGCVITVDDKEAAITDEQGRFVLHGLRSGTYSVKTNSSYCESYSAEVQFLNETQFTLITVVDSLTLSESIEKMFEEKNYEKAENQILRLLSINRNNSNAVMYLALLRYKENNYDASLRVLKDAEQRGITDAWMRKFRQTLEAEYEKG